MSEPAPVWPYDSGAKRPSRFFIVAILTYGTLYALTAATSLQGGDTSELLVVVFRGSRGHPPGYPLYMLLAKAATWLPLLNPTLALSLFSGACAVAALVTLRRGLLRWGMPPAAAGVAALVFGVSPSLWRYAGVPEVFALNAWLAALLLWAVGRGAGPQGIARAGLIGLFVGLGLANSHTIVLLAPLALLGAWRAWREAGRASRRILACLAGFGMLALGLAPYLTLTGSAGPTGWAWGGTLSLDGLLRHFLRSDYGTVRLALTDMTPSPLENTWAWGAHLWSGLGLLLPFALGALWCATRALRRWRARPDDAADAAALVASLILAGPVFFALANLRPEGIARHVMERFYILPDLLMCALGAVGLAWLVAWRPRLTEYVRAAAIGLVCALVLVHYNEVDWSEDQTVEDYLVNALTTVEPRAVIVGVGELQLFGFLAAREVLAYRTDVAYIDLNLLRTQWYYERVQAEVPELDLPFDPFHTSSYAVVSALLPKRPVYIAELRLVPELEDRVVPIGPLLRVLPEAEPLPEPAAVEQENLALFRELQFRGRPPTDPTSWSARALSYYARTWHAIAGAFEQIGEPRRAAQAETIANAYEVGEGP